MAMDKPHKPKVRIKEPINVLPMNLPLSDSELAMKIKNHNDQRALAGYGIMKKPPSGEDVSMTAAYQETKMFKAEKLLHEAAKLNKVDVMKTIVKRGTNVNCTNNLDRTPLHWACSHGSLDAVKYLLREGAFIEKADKYGMRAILWAAWFGHVDILKFLLACGSDPAVQNKQGLNLMHCASHENRHEVVNFILEYTENFPLSDKDKKGKTCLHIAAEQGHAEVVKILIKKIPIEELKERDSGGQDPFLLACASGSAESVDCLLRAGSDIHSPDTKGKTGLHLAAEKGHHEVCNLLLQFPDNGIKSDLDGKDDNKNEIVENNGESSFFSNLVKSSASKTSSDQPKLEAFELKNTLVNSDPRVSALHLAAMNGHLEAVITLIENGCDANIRDQIGNTPLHTASEAGHSDVIGALLEHGAQIDRVNKKLQTPLHIAVEKGLEKPVKALLQRGANSKAQEKFGRTALYIASRGSFHDIVDMIIKSEIRAKKKSNDDVAKTMNGTQTTEQEVVEDTGTTVEGSMIVSEAGMDVVDTELPEPETEEKDIFNDFRHPHAKILKPILYKLAHKQLAETDWKKMAFYFKFESDHIKAIQRTSEEKLKYKEQGYRMLLIWLHEVDPSSNPAIELHRVLRKMDKKNLAESVKKSIEKTIEDEYDVDDDEQKKKTCAIS